MKPVPDLLLYARYHGLATDHLAERLPWPSAIPAAQEDFAPIGQVIEESKSSEADELDSWLSRHSKPNVLFEDKIELTDAAAQFLSRATKRPILDWKTMTWEQFEPPPDHSQICSNAQTQMSKARLCKKLRLEMPLLVSNHTRDMVKFRKMPTTARLLGLVDIDEEELKAWRGDNERWMEDVVQAASAKREKIPREKLRITQDEFKRVSVCLEKISQPPAKVVRSEQLLWRPPIPLILKIDDDEEILLDETMFTKREHTSAALEVSPKSPESYSKAPEKRTMEVDHSINGVSDLATLQVSPEPPGPDAMLPPKPKVEFNDGMSHAWDPAALQVLTTSTEPDVQLTQEPKVEVSDSMNDTSESVSLQVLPKLPELDSMLPQKRKIELIDSTNHTVESNLVKAIAKFNDFTAPGHDLGAFSISNMLSSHLDSRSIKFKKPKIECGRFVGGGEVQDPIQATQEAALKLDTEPATESPLPLSGISISGLCSPRTIFVNSGLIESHRSLFRYLEAQTIAEEEPGSTETNMLTIIYRDSPTTSEPDQGRGVLPDIILNPKVCIILTTLQAMTQKTLPGQAISTRNGQTAVHERALSVAVSFETVFILVSFPMTDDDTNRSMGENHASTWAYWCGSCASLAPRCMAKSIMVPVSGPRQALGGMEPTGLPTDQLQISVWTLIAQYGLETSPNAVLGKHMKLLQDETCWSLFLQQCGMNSFASQVILASLRRTEEQNEEWGLRRFVRMSAEERIQMFKGVIDTDAIRSVSTILEGSFQVAKKSRPYFPSRDRAFGARRQRSNAGPERKDTQKSR